MTGSGRSNQSKFIWDWLKHKFSFGSSKRFAGATLDTDKFSFEVFRNVQQRRESHDKTVKFERDINRLICKKIEEELKFDAGKENNGLKQSTTNMIIAKPESSTENTDPAKSESVKRNTFTRFKNRLRSSFAGISAPRKEPIKENDRFSDVGVLEEKLFFQNIVTNFKESHPVRLFSLKSSSISSPPSPSLSSLPLSSLSSSSISTIASTDSFSPDIEMKADNVPDYFDDDGAKICFDNLNSSSGVEINSSNGENLKDAVKVGIYDNIPFDRILSQLQHDRDAITVISNQDDYICFDNEKNANSEYVYCNGGEARTNSSLNFVDSSKFNNSLSNFPAHSNKKEFKTQFIPSPSAEINGDHFFNNSGDNFCFSINSNLPYLPPKTYKRTYSDNQLRKTRSRPEEEIRRYHSLKYSKPDSPDRDFSHLSKSVAMKCQLFCQKVDEMSNNGYIPMKIQSYNRGVLAS